MKTCETYADAFSTKAFCFDDLKGPLRRLDQTRLQSFRDARVAAADQNTLEQLFDLELEYSLLPDTSTTKELVDFAVRALKLYHASLSETSSQPCPEAAFLAVLAILRLGTTSSSTTDPQKNSQGQQQPSANYDNVLRAIILLETVRSSFADYYQLTVVLIRLQAYLGQLSSAMTTFTKLSVKNMQYETVAHLILTRISSLHPAAITIPSESTTGGGGGAFDPLTAIETGLTVLENADGALVRGIREGLRFNSYSNIHNSVEMRLQLQNSTSRRIYAVEERKLRRLRGLSDDNTVLDFESESEPQDNQTKLNLTTPLADNRDFSYFPHFRDDDAELVQTRFRCGPLPREQWVHSMARLDHVVTFFRAELTGQQAGAAVGTKALDNIKALAETLESKGKCNGDGASEQQEEDSLTDTERWNLECHGLLAKAALWLGDTSASASVPEEHNVADLLTQLKTWLQKTLESQQKEASPTSSTLGASVAGIQIYIWSSLHTSITRLETLQAVALLLGILGKKAKTAKGKTTIPKPALAEIQALVVELEKGIHGAVRAVREGINAPGVLGKLVDLGFARDGEGDGQGKGEGTDGGDLAALADILEMVSDEVKMETICGKIKDSWEDALDGVLAVKVKIWK